MKILLIEDSTRLQRSIARGLRKAGYKVDATGDGIEGLWYIESFPYDVVILDIMLPGLDGISILERIRNQKNDVHVIILSAKETVNDRINGLKSGADDYLTKPFSFDELLARIEALIRRKYGKKSNIIRLNDIEIDLSRKSVSYKEQVVDLPPREYSLFEYLALNRGRVVKRTEIEEHIYDERVEPMSNVVDAAISLLRNIILQKTGNGIITTKRGVGYIIE